VSFLAQLERRGGAPSRATASSTRARAPRSRAWTSSDIARDSSSPARSIRPAATRSRRTSRCRSSTRKIDASDERSGTGLRDRCRATTWRRTRSSTSSGKASRRRPSRCASTARSGAAGTRARLFFGDVAEAAFAGGQCVLTVEPKHGALSARSAPALPGAVQQRAVRRLLRREQGGVRRRRLRSTRSRATV
jgi:hypothetical protein